MKQSYDLWTRCSSLVLLLAGFLVSAGAWAGGVAIDSASWDSRYHPDELYIRGSGEDRSEISIYDADSDVLIAQVTASDRGSWRYTASNPSAIPCRVRAESRGERDTRSVSNADNFPGGCGTNGGGTPPPSTGLPNQTDFKMMMNYELGMHCTGFEFAYCCVLPVYNSILAQVVKPEGGSNDFPRLLEADPNNNVASILDGGTGDVLGRQTVIRDPSALNGAGNFKKYVLRYWHDAQPRNDGNGKAQSDTLISNVEGNSLLSWNTVADAADINPAPGKPGHNPAFPEGAMITGTYNGAKGVVLGNGDFTDVGGTFGVPIDNYQNVVWNHLYIYDVSAAGVEGHKPAGVGTEEKDKYRLGLHVDYPTNFGPAGHNMEGLLTFSGDSGTVVYTQMKVLEDLPITLTSPRIWEALGLPLTPFEDSIDFFGDPGKVDEDSIRPYVQMKARLHHAICDGDGICTEGDAVLDSAGNEVIGFGTAPIDIPNCERCHSAFDTPNSPNVTTGTPEEQADAAMVQTEINFWNAYYDIDTTAGDSDWYSRLKGAGISILARHDSEHGTSFLANYPGTGALRPAVCERGDVGTECSLHSDCDTLPGAGDGQCDIPQNTRTGHESVICQKCHADNVIAVVKSANCGAGSKCEVTAADELFSNISGANPLTGEGHLIPPLTEALHWNHRETSEGGTITMTDSHGRSGGCQGCHPAHRSSGDMDGYPIDLDGNNEYALSDNRDANGGCFVGRDVHSNPMKDVDGAGTPEHLNPVGQWLADNVASDTGSWKGIWCTNCHSQAGQQLWKAEDVDSLVHAKPGDPGHVREPSANAELGDVVAAVNAALGTSTSTQQFIDWLDPKDPSVPGSGRTVNQNSAIWAPDPGICDHVKSLFGAAPSTAQDGNVATIEVAIGAADGTGCSTGIGLPGPNCGLVEDGSIPGGADFFICGSLDPDSDVSVSLVTIGTVNEDGTGALCAPGVDDPCYAQSSPFCTTTDCVNAAKQYLADRGFTTTAVPVPMSAATDGRDHWLAPGEPHCADCHAAPYVEQSGNINAFPPFNYPQKASLMRYSRGHQDITCQGCHESIHGLYPVTPGIDTTTYAQAASLNPGAIDDPNTSHGPLVCGACHKTNSEGVWAKADDLEYNGVRIKDNFDAAVSWMHTFTDEADPRPGFCQNCHGDEADEMYGRHDGRWEWNDEWLEHSMKGRVSRNTMDQVEVLQVGHVAGDPDVEDPLQTVCRSCHGDESDHVRCSEKEWKEHLTEGRVSEKVWEDVSIKKAGSTCGW